MIDEIYQYLINEGKAALSVDVVRGYPRWGRVGLNPPVAGLEIIQWQPAGPRRIGQGEAREALGLRWYLFARHDQELSQMLGSLAAWWRGHKSAEVNSQTVSIQITVAQRAPNETGVQQEDHGFWIEMTTSWSV